MRPTVSDFAAPKPILDGAYFGQLLESIFGREAVLGFYGRKRRRKY